MHSWDEKQAIFDEHGRALDEIKARQLSTAMWDIISEAFVHSNENSESIGSEESLLDFFQARLAGRTRKKGTGSQPTSPADDQGKAEEGRGQSRTTAREDLPNHVDHGDCGKATEPSGLDIANLTPKQRQQLLWMAEMWGAFVGGTVDKQSLRYFWLEECIEGGKFPIPLNGP